jgi:hypothetical protein
MNKVGLFIILAVVIAVACYVLLGVLLLPALGLGGIWLTVIPGAISGGSIALIYFNMFKGPNAN